MSNMRQWLDLPELYENFQSNIHGEFEESGWIYIEEMNWVEMHEHEGYMSVQFAATHYNKEWTAAANELSAGTGGMYDSRVPPFIDEDQLWIAIANFLEGEGYKDLGASFDIDPGSWHGDGIGVYVSDGIVSQAKGLKMKKRFKKESISESPKRFLDEDEFFIEVLSEYGVKNPTVYFEWSQKYNRHLKDMVEDDLIYDGHKDVMLKNMNATLKRMNPKIRIVDIGYQHGAGIYKIQHIPPLNFRQKESVNEDTAVWVDEDEFFRGADLADDEMDDWSGHYKLADVDLEFDGKQNVIDEMNEHLKRYAQSDYGSGKVRVRIYDIFNKTADGEDFPMYKIQYTPPKNFRK